MKKNIIIVSIMSAAIAGVFYRLNNTKANGTLNEQEQIVNMPDLKTWPETSKKVAKEMEGKYGKPNEVTSDMLIWKNNGIWLKTIVYKTEMTHNFPKSHKDVIEQWINYNVPFNNFDELALYNGSVTANRTNGTISARCDNEAMNLLALNLAFDIVNNSKTVDEARMDHSKNEMAFIKGEKPAYTRKINFINDKTAPDPDKPYDLEMEQMKLGQKK